jgi:MFS family permease
MATAENIGGTSNPASNNGYGSKGYRAYVLSALLTVYIFNFIDRSIINILTDPIKASFQLEDWQMGMLGGPAFAILYTFLGIPIARGAERFNRVWIISIAVFLWSLMTVLCGFATSFLMLFLFRVGVSIGEAGCTPPAQSLIADYYTPRSRSTAVSIYALGVPLGGMFAAIFGGTIAGSLSGPGFADFLEANHLTLIGGIADWRQFEGWQLAFILVGLPGILLAGIVKLSIQEPPRGYTDPANAQTKEHVSFSQALTILRSKPTFWHIVFGATIASFIGYAVGQFSTSFFLRTHGFSLREAALTFGLIIGLMAALGVFLSGFLADKFAKRFPTALSWMPALGMAISAPLYGLGYLADSFWLALPALMLAATLHYFYLGPMYAVAGGVVDSRTRATSVAITLFIVNILGYGLGPPAIGFLSTYLKSVFLSQSELDVALGSCKILFEQAALIKNGTADAFSELQQSEYTACLSADARGLQWALVIFCMGYVWAAAHYLLAGRTLKRDMIGFQD